VTIDGVQPNSAFVQLDEAKKRLFDSARIGAVSLDPTKGRITVYSSDPKHGIWYLQLMGGQASWVLLGSTETSGFLVWKQTKASSSAYLQGLDQVIGRKAILNTIYERMLDRLSYSPGAGINIEGVVSGSVKEGQCHSVNKAMATLMQAGLASQGLDPSGVGLREQTTPFLTSDEKTNSIIRGKSNIMRENESPYTGNRIKFDDHVWVVVDGSVYDLVAGLKGAGQSCVDQLIEGVDDSTYQWGEKVLRKVEGDGPGAPWLSGYALSNAP
jgi:hypothetical protein